jgi:hypothetical protein
VTQGSVEGRAFFEIRKIGAFLAHVVDYQFSVIVRTFKFCPNAHSEWWEKTTEFLRFSVVTPRQI